ncbi:hypothetical protein MKEN_01109400 [Mycena kentingensis (nom. inval.)]|nr:hypothetical protein MKEN_01109400 [Mycena kentingensis (nom. inval.)]
MATRTKLPTHKLTIAYLILSPIFTFFSFILVLLTLLAPVRVLHNRAATFYVDVVGANVTDGLFVLFGPLGACGALSDADPLVCTGVTTNPIAAVSTLFPRPNTNTSAHDPNPGPAVLISKFLSSQSDLEGGGTNSSVPIFITLALAFTLIHILLSTALAVRGLTLLRAHAATQRFRTSIQMARLGPFPLSHTRHATRESAWSLKSDSTFKNLERTTAAVAVFAFLLGLVTMLVLRFNTLASIDAFNEAAHQPGLLPSQRLDPDMRAFLGNSFTMVIPAYSILLIPTLAALIRAMRGARGGMCPENAMFCCFGV